MIVYQFITLSAAEILCQISVVNNCISRKMSTVMKVEGHKYKISGARCS